MVPEDHFIMAKAPKAFKTSSDLWTLVGISAPNAEELFSQQRHLNSPSSHLLRTLSNCTAAVDATLARRPFL
jgi:hypothetical protein